jgi:hypothetical protein
MIDTIHRFLAITGRVTDDATSGPIAGAQARIVSAPRGFQPRMGQAGANTGPQDLEVTGPDGFFHFMNLPNGDYEIELKAMGAPPVNAKLAVVRAPGVAMRPVNADVKLDLTATPAAAATKPAKSKADRRPKEERR